MKCARTILLSGVILVSGFTGAMAQSRDGQPRIPGLVVAAPFQALGNLIRNPDADRPLLHAARTAPPDAPNANMPGTPNNAQANPQGAASPSP